MLVLDPLSHAPGIMPVETETQILRFAQNDRGGWANDNLGLFMVEWPSIRMTEGERMTGRCGNDGGSVPSLSPSPCGRGPG